MTPPSVCDTSRDGSAAGRLCPVCAAPLPSARARYCSHACRQQAFRLRQPTTSPVETATLTKELHRQKARVAHTVYECPECGSRFLGEQRCAQCNQFCRALGLGGACPDCDAPVLLSDLIDLEVLR